MAKAPKKNDPNAKDTRGRRKGQRGARKGTTTAKQDHGGSIGQQPYEPDERDREYVRENVWYIGQDKTAKRLGISKKTLQRHFKDEIEHCETDLEKQLGQTAMEKALAGDGPMLRFLLATRFKGRWSPRVNHRHEGQGGGPIRTVDMGPLIEGKTEDELAELEKILESIGAAAVGGSGPEGDRGRDTAGS